jgi:hypothetical protein
MRRASDLLFSRARAVKMSRLRREVESLLASHEKDGSSIDSAAYEAAAELLVDENSELTFPFSTVGHA